MAFSHEVIIGSADEFLQDELASGELIKVLPEFSWGVITYYLVKPNNLRKPIIDLVAKFIEKCYQEL